MSQSPLKKALCDRQDFVVCVELTGGPNFNLAPVEAFIKDYEDQGPAAIPDGFVFSAVTFPQNPGGAANIDPMDAYFRLDAEGLLETLDYMPHLTCKDHNASAMMSALVAYQHAGIECLLVMTGDRPVGSKPVFELDSLGALQMVQRINHDAYLKASPERLEAVPQFFPAAAVSPFKYTQGSLMQQYFKMEKKIASGARFFMTQVGWDWKKSQELFWYMRDENLDVPVLGNVYLLGTQSPAPRLMHDVKLAGCFVSSALLAKVMGEGVDNHVERAAQQVAMYRAMGAAGVDIAGVHSFRQFQLILSRAAEIGEDWESYKDNLCWPADEAFYLYDGRGQRKVLSVPSHKTTKQTLFDLAHRTLLDPAHQGFHAFRKTMGFLGGDKDHGFTYKSFNAAEKGLKYLLFECQECGDCFLPENFGLCSLGRCKKGLSNAPCGDATVDGRCGNDLDRVCVGERIYQAAAAHKDGLEQLRTRINKPRNTELTHTSSVLNYLFARDHTMKNAIISIGESVHASIPKTGEVMKQLQALGRDAYTTPSAPLNYIRALIESQADDGADYLAVNLDAFGDQDMQVTADMMEMYVKLVRQWGKGVPVCIDSGNDDVLIAGLKAWYDTTETVPSPLVNSVKTFTMDCVLPLKAEYDFSFIGLLVGEDASSGPGGTYSVDQLYGMAREIFDRAADTHGFKPEQMFFDSTVFPLAIDMPMEPNVPGYTYRAFETIKKIKADSRMKGVHCSLGVSNSVRDLPARRIGICRAYVAVAMEYGLDAGIVNAAHHYGAIEPAPELSALIKAYAQMDGSADKMDKAITLMGRFCQENRKSPR